MNAESSIRDLIDYMHDYFDVSLSSDDGEYLESERAAVEKANPIDVGEYLLKKMRDSIDREFGRRMREVKSR